MFSVIGMWFLMFSCCFVCSGVGFYGWLVSVMFLKRCWLILFGYDGMVSNFVIYIWECAV